MYKCKICDKVFEKQMQLAGHCNSHKKKICHCKVCGKEFNNETSLKGHLSSHSRKPKKIINKIYSCRYCGKVCKNGLSLGGHITNCHDNPNKKERNRKISLAGKGRKLTEETKRKISKSRKKYLNENPGQIPYLLNHSSKESYPEKLFRERLEAEGIDGWVQEYPYLRYSLDFAFIDKKINIEVDGGTHNLEAVKKKDKIRNKTLINDGWVVYRISDYDVKNNLDIKIGDIKNLLNNTN